jgi:hypothetical protein
MFIAQNAIEFVAYLHFDETGYVCAWAVPLRECPPPASPSPPLFRCEKQPNHSLGLWAR